MPLYEYYCEDCHGVFELLKPAREAPAPQPCPECDTDAPRIVSDFAAFVFREGYARRIPDDRSYLHVGKKVAAKNAGGAPAHEHPELWSKKRQPPTPPTVAELEANQAEERAYREHQRESIDSGLNPVQDEHLDKKLSAFTKRRRQTAAQAKQQRRREPNVKTTARTVSGKHARTSKK